jgi:pectate lyase
MATYTDALTGSGAIGGDWAVVSPANWQRSASGSRQEQSTGAYRRAAYTAGAMDSNDYRVEATIAYDSDAGLGHGVAARWASGTAVTCYGLIRFANEVYFVELTAGAETQLVLVSTPGTGSVTLRIEVEGTTIRSYVGGALVDTRSDASLASGAPGLVAYGGGTGATDNYATTWSAEDLGPPPPTSDAYMTPLRGIWG